MANVLVISFSNLDRDTRVRRQLLALRGAHQVTAVGHNAPGIDGIDFIPTGFSPKGLVEKAAVYSRLLFGHFLAAYWYPKWTRKLKKTLEGRSFDVIIANDTDALPLAFSLPGRVVFDSHEYAPREFEDSLAWRLVYQRYRTWLCAEYAPQAAACITVAEGIAEEFEKQFGVRFAVMPNFAYYQDLAPQPTDPATIRLVHHGLAHPSRRLEDTLAMMRHLDKRFHLDLYLVGDAGYIQQLERMAREMENVTFCAPVGAEDICAMLGRYDMGVFLLDSKNFNYVHALPNKFFEFVQARLAVAIGPSVEMAPYVRAYGCGIVADTFVPQELARRLNALDAAAIDGMKQNSDGMAKEVCAEKNAEVLQKMVAGLMG